jgi:hypothetical protein
MNKWHLNVLGIHKIEYRGKPFIFELMEDGKLEYIAECDENVRDFLVGYLKNKNRTKLIDKILNDN